MKRVVVLAGGMSSERAVSLESGRAVLKALLDKGYEALMLDVQMPLSGLVSALEQFQPAVVFNALHGQYGEDGCIQGLLNLMHIPYTHSGVLASALSMNKQQTKKLVAQNGLDVPNGRLVQPNEIQAGGFFKMPYVLKPNDEGSSVGVFIIRTQAEEDQMRANYDFKKEMLAEEYIAGRELSVVVTDEGAVGIVEIVPKSGFYDYANKYTEGKAEHVIPAHLSSQWEEYLMKSAETAHRLLGCRGVSRSDFRLDEEKERAVFLELNANPGMTALSLVPEVLLKVRKKSYADFVAELVEKARYEG